MITVFDYQAFEMQRFGGVSRSYAELIAHLKKSDNCVCKIGVKESNNIHLKECGLGHNIRPLHYTHGKHFGGKKMFKGQRTLTRLIMRAHGHSNDYLDINKEYCIKLLKKQKFDIFEPTFFDSYFLPYIKNKPFVLTVHDMIPELLGVDEPQAKQKKLLCPLASHIHVPSQNTKKDLINILNIPEERITVIPHGSPNTPQQREPIYTFPYILYVGARWSYKNFTPFIKECADIITKHPDIHVICTGEIFSDDEMKLFSELKITDNMINVHHAAEETLQALYQHAVAFVYPSAYEGFGIPILEAFVNECPVMLNNASCFPEIAGDAAIYFDIDKRGDLAERFIDFYQSSSDTRQALIDKGRIRAESYSWEKSAELLSKIYKALI